jgi:hypothetical protein
MNRNALEHIIRAAGEIAQVKKVIILGSQSILAQLPDLSEFVSKFDQTDVAAKIQNREILIRSIEADVMIPDSEEKTELVEAVMGELSMFHDTFGYYAQGVDLATSKLPEGWDNRLVEICNENTNGISGMCLEVHDVMVSKLYAGRPKDIEFFEAAVTLGLLSEETLRERLTKTAMSDERRKIVENHIKKGFSK